jgi:phage-related minor tail protein
VSDILGYTTLQVIPVFKNIGASISGVISGPLTAEGAAAGASAGQAAANGIAAAEAAVRAASGKLAKARAAEVDQTGKITVAEAQLKALRDKGVTDVGRIAAAEEKVEKARRDGVRMTDNATQAADDLAAAEERAANATDEVGESAQKTGGFLKGLFGGLDTGAKKLAAFAVAGAGVGGAMELGMKSLENGATFDKLAAQMGASSTMAKEYGTMAGSLYASGLGESMGDAADAVGLVASSFPTAGFEGEKTIDALAAKAMNFSSIFDTDVATAVQTASQLINDGLAVDGTQAFDMLTASFQRVPAAMREEVPELMQEYGTIFSNLGFDGQEGFGLLVSAAGKGKFAMDKTGDALKEFSILASDGSKSTAEAYKAIGGDAEVMAKAVVGGGDAAQAALTETAQRLLDVEDPAERAQLAIALFGAPLEDMSVAQIPQFLEGITGAGDAMAGFEGTLDTASDTMNSGPLSALQTLGRGLETNLTNMLGDKVMPLLGQFSGALEGSEGDLFAAAAGAAGLGGAFSMVGEAKGTFDSVSESVGAAKEQIVGIKDSVVGAAENVKKGWSKAADAGHWVVAKAKAVGSFVATATSATINAVKTSAAWVGAQAKTAAGWTVAAAKATGSFIVMATSASVNAIKTSASWLAAQAKLAAGWAVGAATAIGSFIAMSASAALEGGKMAATWVATNARVAGSFLVSKAAMVGSAAVTGTLTAAQWLLNAAMSANPITLIIIALVALGAGLVLLWTKSETFRGIVTGAFDAVKNVIVGVWDWISANWPLLLAIITGPIGMAVYLITKHWDTIKEGIAAVKDWIVEKWNDVVGFFTALPGRLGAIASTMWQGALDAVGAVKDWVVQKWDEVIGFVTGLGGRIRSAASGMWDGITEGFKSALNWLIQKWNNFSLGFEFKIPVVNKEIKFNIGTPDLPLLATGGVAGVRDSKLYGPGSGTSDSILAVDKWGMPTARVSAGEGVVKKSAMAGAGYDVVRALNAGWVPSVEWLNSMLPGYAQGGSIDNAMDFARGMDPVPYEMGGYSRSSIDCSGFVAAVVNSAMGEDPFGGRMSTVNEGDWLAGKGALSGMGGDGDLRIGWYDQGGGANGHTAGTFPDGTNFESNGSEGVVIGGSTGYDDPMFTDHAYFPGSMFTGGDLGVPSYGGQDSYTSNSDGTGGLSFGGGASGGSGGSGGGSGMSWSGGGKVGSGEATPVFVVNYADFGGMSSSSSMSTPDTTYGGSDPAAAPETPPVGGTGVDGVYMTPENIAKVEQIGVDYRKSNEDQFMSDLGLSGINGSLTEFLRNFEEINKAAQSVVHYHVTDIDEAMRKENERRQRETLTFTR